MNTSWNSIIIAYNVLTCFAVVFVTIVLVLPLILNSVRRRYPWYSHLLSWLVVSISLSLSIGHQSGLNPPGGLCFLQTALLYAAIPLATFSMTCYLLDINLLISSVFNKKATKRIGSRKSGYSIFLAIFPWFIFLLVIVEVSIVHSFLPREPHEGEDKKKRSGSMHLVCKQHNHISDIITALLFILGSIVLVCTKVWTATIFFRHYKSYKWTNIKIAQMVLSAFIRTSVFTAFSLFGIILGELGDLQEDDKRGWCLIFPIMPIIAAVIYGMQMDILRSLMFWKKTQNPDDDVEKENNCCRAMTPENKTEIQIPHGVHARHHGEEPKLSMTTTYNRTKLLPPLPGPLDSSFTLVEHVD